MGSSDTGKVLIAIGGIVLLVGVVVYLWGNKLHWIGHLPGDIRVERENFRFYFPITTLILLNVLIFIIMRIWRYLNG